MEMAGRIDDSLSFTDLQKWTASPVHSGSRKDAASGLELWNRIIGQLSLLDSPPDSLGPFLIDTLTNSSLSPAIRDYAAQHLSSLVRGKPGNPPASFAAAAIAALCATATASPQIADSPSGTALLSLADLGSHDAQMLDPYWPVLVPAICRLIDGDSTPDLLRIAALQTAAGTRRREFHFPLQTLLARPGVPDAVRLAGVASLRAFADPADRSLLQSLAASGGFAARAASTALQSPPFVR